MKCDGPWMGHVTDRTDAEGYDARRRVDDAAARERACRAAHLGEFLDRWDVIKLAPSFGAVALRGTPPGL